MLKVGVIGLGIGKVHTSNYLENPKSRLAGVSDINKDLLKQVSEKYGVRGYPDYKNLLEQDLDAVSVCTPPKLHREIVSEAANRGLHVLCEKPMAPTIEDCNEMIRTCLANNVKLMIGFKKRFNPAYRKLKDLTASTLGEALAAQVFYMIGRVDRSWFWNPADGGGVTAENSVHNLDMLRFLMGDVKTVYSEIDNYTCKDLGDLEDTACTALRFKNGCIASLATGCSNIWQFSTERLELICREGCARVYGSIDHVTNLEYNLRDSPEVLSYAWRDTNIASGFPAEVDHFLDCILEDQNPIASGEDGREALRLALAIRESGRQRSPVHLP